METELHSENALEQIALTIGVGTSQMLTQIAISLFYVFLTLHIHNWIDNSFGSVNDAFLKFIKNFMDPKTLTKYTHFQTQLFSLRCVVP